MADPSELEAWREVHSKLLIACDLAQEAVDFQRAEQRYWMQEIVANLNEDGQVVPSSVWTRATDIPKKTLSKREIKKLYQNAGVIKRKADDDTVTSNESSAVAKKKRRKKATATPPPTMPEKDSHDTEEEEEADKSIPPDSLNTEEPQKPPSFPYEAQNPLQMMVRLFFAYDVLLYHCLQSVRSLLLAIDAFK